MYANITFEKKVKLHILIGFLALEASACWLMVVSTELAAMGVFLGIFAAARRLPDIYHVKKVFESTLKCLDFTECENIYLCVSWSVKLKRLQPDAL